MTAEQHAERVRAQIADEQAKTLADLAAALTALTAVEEEYSAAEQTEQAEWRDDELTDGWEAANRALERTAERRFNWIDRVAVLRARLRTLDDPATLEERIAVRVRNEEKFAALRDGANDRPHEAADTTTEEVTMSKAASTPRTTRKRDDGPKVEQARKQREQKVAATPPAVIPPVEDVTGQTPEPGRTSDDLMTALLDRVSTDIDGVEFKGNEKVGYTAVRLDGKVLGYGWTTKKAAIRVEVALPLDGIAPARRALFTACKRSASIQSQIKVTDDDGISAAVEALELAAKAVKDATAAKEAAAA